MPYAPTKMEATGIQYKTNTCSRYRFCKELVNLDALDVEAELMP
jgi:hypothetical protein